MIKRRGGVFARFGAIVGVAALLSMPVAAGDQDFVLINGTGYVISEVYVSPVKAGDWEEDVLGRDVLGVDDRTEIRFSRDTDACRWDLKVVYEDDGSSAEWGNLNLCEISAVTLRYSRKTGETSAYTE